MISLIARDRTGSSGRLVVVVRAMLAASVAAAPAALAACGDPGPIGGIPTGVLEPDAAIEAGLDAIAFDAGTFDAPPPVEGAAVPDPFAGAPPYTKGTDPAAHLADTHYVGQSCGTGNCHAPGVCGSAPCWLIGGTAYVDYIGTVAAPGVEIRVVDMQGHAASCYVGANGNFRIPADAGVTLPAMVGARDGTTTRPMVTKLSNGMCGTSGCHNPMGSPAKGDYYPVHVP